MTDINWRDVLPSAGVSDETLPVSAAQEAPGGVLVPAMTEEEVEQSTASHGKKMVLVIPPSTVTSWQFKTVISAAYMLYMNTHSKLGRIPTLNEVVLEVDGRVSEKTTKTIYESAQFRRAMLIRGIDFTGQTHLSPEQDMAIAIMSNPTDKTFEQKLKTAGVAPSKWRAWLKQKYFREAWNAIGGNVLYEHENDMLVSLVGQALTGDVPAIKFALEVSGRHAPARQQSVDATIVIAQLIEIVQEEVKDLAVLARIAVRMQMVGGTPAARGIIESAVPSKPIDVFETVVEEIEESD